MNVVAVEQVEETKLLGVTLDCKLSWSKHIDSMVVNMGRGLSVIKRCSAFLTPHSKKQVLQALVLSHLDYCLVMWSSAARKYIIKLQLAQNRAAHLALHCNQRVDINTMHASLSWLRVEERLTALKIPKFVSWVCLHTHSSDTHTYPTRHATTRTLFTVPKSRTNSRRRTVLYRAIIAWELHFISYCSNEQQTWFQKTDKAMPLPYLT